jgi:hypothetical protein
MDWLITIGFGVAVTCAILITFGGAILIVWSIIGGM